MYGYGGSFSKVSYYQKLPPNTSKLKDFYNKTPILHTCIYHEHSTCFIRLIHLAVHQFLFKSISSELVQCLFTNF